MFTLQYERIDTCFQQGTIGSIVVPFHLLCMYNYMYEPSSFLLIDQQAWVIRETQQESHL
jgi:hypothetical protein